MSTLLTALNPFVLPSVEDCANTVAQFHIRQAAIEFCRRTLIWRKTLPAVASVLAPLTFTAPLVAALSGTLTVPFAGPTRGDYTLTFSDGSSQTVTLNNGSTAVTWLNAVTGSTAATYSQSAYTIPTTTDGEIAKLLKFSVDSVKRSVVTPNDGEDLVYLLHSTPFAAWTIDRVNFNVTPPPNVAGTQYGLVVALMPTQAATSIPDDVFNGHAESIAAGALARLFGLPKRPWTDKTLARDKREYFEDRIGVVAAQVSKGFSRGRRRVKAHTF